MASVGCGQVAVHARNAWCCGYTTRDDHMPAAHRAHTEWTPERLFHCGASLALSCWVENATTLVISGPICSGKIWLACVFAQHACRRGHSALYLRVPRLAEELLILHGNGGFLTWLAALARTDVLILDDWALAPLDTSARADLLEMIDDRAGTGPTTLTTQLPVEHWHSWIGDPTIADAILDRLLAREHRIALKGESLRPDRARTS